MLKELKWATQMNHLDLTIRLIPTFLVLERIKGKLVVLGLYMFDMFILRKYFCVPATSCIVCNYFGFWYANCLVNVWWLTPHLFPFPLGYEKGIWKLLVHLIGFLLVLGWWLSSRLYVHIYLYLYEFNDVVWCSRLPCELIKI